MGGRRKARHGVGLRSRVCLLALATTALTPPALSWSQPAPPQPGVVAPGTSAAELNPSTRVSRPPPRRSSGAFAPEPPGPCPLETSDVQVTLNSVTFRGATAVSVASFPCAV